MHELKLPIPLNFDSVATTSTASVSLGLYRLFLEFLTEINTTEISPRCTMASWNHPFRLDSQGLLSYLTNMRVLTLAVTPENSATFWNTIHFYTAPATAGNLGYDCNRGRHRTVSTAVSRRHVDASLDSFTKKGHMAVEM